VIESPTALLAFLFLVVAFTRFLEGRSLWVEKISSAVVCTLLGIVLGNLGIIPHSSPVQEAVFDYAVPYAIVLVILSSNLGDLKKAGRGVVLCYVLAAAASFAGGLVAGVTFSAWVGPQSWKLAGQFAGAFVGGGMNFVAVGRGLDTSPDLFAAASVADNLSTVPYLLAQVALANWLKPYFREPPGGVAEGPSEGEDDPRRVWTTAAVSITDLSILAALPLGALWLSTLLSPLLPGFPQVLWLTTLSLAAAQLPVVRRLRGAAMLSYFALHLFFIVLGASSVVREVLRAGPSIFVFMLAVIVIHVLVVYGVGWLAGFDLPTISVASQAAVGGPGSALALALSMKWSRLVTPGIIVGIFGYALGNYIGFGCAYLLRGMS
jgi:uncharacterized membrane protein